MNRIGRRDGRRATFHRARACELDRSHALARELNDRVGVYQVLSRGLLR
jgi:hypothetical protein